MHSAGDCWDKLQQPPRPCIHARGACADFNLHFVIKIIPFVDSNFPTELRCEVNTSLPRRVVIGQSCVAASLSLAVRQNCCDLRIYFSFLFPLHSLKLVLWRLFKYVTGECLNPLLTSAKAEVQNEQQNQKFVVSFLCSTLEASQTRPGQQIFTECRQQQGVLADTCRKSLKYSTYAFL